MNFIKVLDLNLFLNPCNIVGFGSTEIYNDENVVGFENDKPKFTGRYNVVILTTDAREITVANDKTLEEVNEILADLQACFE